MSQSIDERFPGLSSWIDFGWIEIGRDASNRTFLRVLDSSGLVWESDRQYKTLEEAFTDAESAITQWLRENT